MNGRGQLTMFFLLGLVALLVIGLLFLFLRPATDAQATLDTANAAALTSVVGACLDTIVADELRIVGETGGLPPAEKRPGLAYPSAVVPFGTGARRIVYGVTANRDLPGGLLPRAHDPPRYPDAGVGILAPHLFSDDGTLVPLQSFQGHFGDVHLPAICATDGPNGPGTPLRCRNYPGNPPGTGGPSIQEQLVTRIAQRVRACANPDRLTETLGQRVVGVGAPSVNITFTPNNLLVKLSYPLELEGSVTTRVETTPRTYRVRLMPLLQFAHALAHAEARNVTFDPVADATTLPEHRPGFIVARTPVAATAQSLNLTPIVPPVPRLSDRASVILITDQRSETEGVTYSYAFLVEHRGPMLDTLAGDALDAAICAALESASAAGFAADPDGDPVRLALSDGGAAYILQVSDADGSDWLPVSGAQIAAAEC